MFQTEINNAGQAGSSGRKLCQIRVHAGTLHVRGQWGKACFTRIIVKLNNPALSIHLPCLAALETLRTVAVTQSLHQGGQPTDYDRSKANEKVDYFKYLFSLIINDARYRHEIKSSFAMAKPAFNKFDIQRNVLRDIFL